MDKVVTTMSDEFVKELQESARFADSRGYGGLCEKLIKAADAIEELNRKAIEWQEEACKWNNEYHRLLDNMPSWISVKDRLPELGEEVLVYYHWINPPEKGSIGKDSMHIRDISMNPVWKKHPGGKVTHWMPLPEPPKEGGGEDG